MHALIIEDEHMIAFAIEDVLREHGFQSFDIAATAQTAIDAAARRRPDLITSDVRLNPGCGITAVEVICEKPSIPVVFITGNPADVLHRHPNYRVLSKPFSEPALISAVAAAMLETGKAGVEKWAGVEVCLGPKTKANEIVRFGSKSGS